MLRTILIFGLFVFSFTFGFAQNGGSNEKVIFKADTQFSAQSETEIDSEKAKIGGDVYFVITEEVKGEGDGEGQDLHAHDAHAEGLDVGLVLADGDDHAAEVAVHQRAHRRGVCADVPDHEHAVVLLGHMDELGSVPCGGRKRLLDEDTETTRSPRRARQAWADSNHGVGGLCRVCTMGVAMS